MSSTPLRGLTRALAWTLRGVRINLSARAAIPWINPKERKGQPGTLGYKCLFCGSYRCKDCRPSKLKKVRARIAEIAAERNLRRTATLTLDPSRLPRRERTDRYIRECWRKMRVLLARRYGKSLPFVGALEFQ